jgi:hypothetical protein
MLNLMLLIVTWVFSFQLSASSAASTHELQLHAVHM